MRIETVRAIVCVLVALSPIAFVSSATQPAQSTSLVGNEGRGSKTGWTNLVGENHMRQSFTAVGSVVKTVAIALMVANQTGDRDRITVRIYDTGGALRAESTRVVGLGDVGWVQFNMPPGGLVTTPGEVLVIEVSDTGKVLFGWRYTDDRYSGGHAWMAGQEYANRDFLFLIDPPDGYFQGK